MKLVAWNVGVLNDPMKIKEVKDFPNQWVEWIMACVISVSYSVQQAKMVCLLNHFKLRNVSDKETLYLLFLFALSMEYLSRCLGESKDNPDFDFHPKCKRIPLTHLMFVDDLLLFARADHSSMSNHGGCHKVYFGLWFGSQY